jgi:hypothetical protein
MVSPFELKSWLANFDCLFSIGVFSDSVEGEGGLVLIIIFWDLRREI